MVLSRVLPPLAFLVLAAGIAFAVPAVNTFEMNTARIWPPASRGFAGSVGDTMTRAISASDSLDVTDSLAVNGARLVCLLVQSDGADSMSVPILQTRLPGGQWSGAGGALQIPPATNAQTKPLAATTQITPTTIFAWGIYNEVSAGGTPVPFANDYFRWRVKSSDARRYNSASQATLASTGKYQIWAIVVR